MEFEKPSRDLLQQANIILVASEWMNDPPLFNAIIYQQAWYV